MLVILDDPDDRFTGGASAAPVFLRITNRVLPYFGIGGKDISSLHVKKSAAVPDMKFSTIPDFRGMNTAGAAAVLRVLEEKYGMKYYIRGSGRVYGQKPVPGSEIIQGENIILFMR